MFHHESWKLIYLEGQGHEAQKIVPAWFLCSVVNSSGSSSNQLTNVHAQNYLSYRGRGQVVTDRVSREGKAIASVRLSVRLFPLYLLKRLNSELEFLCVCVPLWIMTIARLGLKFEDISQGQRSISSAYGRVNVVSQSVWPRYSIEYSFF